MEQSFIYEAKGQTLIIHMPPELDHHNSRNLRYETDLLMSENYVSRIIFDFSKTDFISLLAANNFSLSFIYIFIGIVFSFPIYQKLENKYNY